MFLGCVEECCITLVSDALGNSWKNLARELDVSATNIENICEDHHGQKEQGIQAIVVWKQRLGGGSYVELLLRALENISRNDVVDQLDKHCREKHLSKKQ